MADTLPTILVFDSGAGGLSIASEIASLRPVCNLLYACDNACFPYGTMDDKHLIERVTNVIHRLTRDCEPDVVVIACNTASTIVLEHCRAHFPFIFVGVVPAIKPAAQLSRTRTIGLLATPATVNRSYTDHLIRDFAPDCTVLRHGSSRLVELAEAELLGHASDERELAAEIAKLTSQDSTQSLDTVVLACTHFPLLLQRLQALPNMSNVQWVDSGEAIARRVSYHLRSLGWPEDVEGSKPGNLEFFYTEAPELSRQLAFERYLSPWFENPARHTHVPVHR